MRVVNSWRQLLVPKGQAADSRSEPSRTAEQVPRHRFGRAHGQLSGVLPEDALKSKCLDGVAEWRGGAMRVNVSYLLGFDSRIANRRAHDAVSAIAIFCRLRNVIGISGHAIADNLRNDGSMAFLRMVQRFKNQDASAFPYDKAVALGVKRAAGALRLIVARRERFHGRESTNTHRRDPRFRAAADHSFGISPLYNPKRIAHTVGGYLTGRGRGRIWPPRAASNLNHSPCN